MTHAIFMHQTGGPEVLRWEPRPVELPAPGPGQARVRHTAVGLNYIDTYQRTGLYPVALPAVIGQEAAGVVEALGPGVTDLSVGDRVAYCSLLGAYSQHANLPAERLLVLPPAITDDQGAAMMLKGLTAQYLLRRTYKVQPGDTILVHAAAGGVGLILCQWARRLGASVIGTVSTEAKARLAQESGCDHVIFYDRENVAERVRALTGGQGVPVVYDGVGQATFAGSLDSLRPLGLLVSYGNASGPVAPFSPALLAQKGSLFLTRPTLATYIASRADYQRGATELFEVVATGAVRIAIGQRYPLAEAAEAHRDLEARRTVGSTLLVP